MLDNDSLVENSLNSTYPRAECNQILRISRFLPVPKNSCFRCFQYRVVPIESLFWATNKLPSSHSFKLQYKCVGSLTLLACLRFSMFYGIRRTVSFLWKTTSLIVLLSIVATIPILQFASLGYMLEVSSRIARGLPVRNCFPGTDIAGRLLIILIFVSLSWLPVWLIADMAYTAELIEPGGTASGRLRVAARLVSVTWIVWVLWTVFRGGKIRHFLWPAPMLAFRSVFRPSVWREAENRLWSFALSLHLPKLFWLGLTASVGALVWLVLPSSFIAIGLIGNGNAGTGLVGLIGAFWMWWVLLQLPFLQIQMASEGRFVSVFDVRSARRSFRRAPWSFCLATWATFVLAIPLYLLRIEQIPTELWWILSLFFVVLMFPAKLLTGWALRRSKYHQAAFVCDVHWFLRYCAWLPQIAVVLIYLGVLYLAKFALWEGTASIYLQHAFLPPVPFFVR